MSNYNRDSYKLEKALRQELVTLNEQIDKKILRGVSYTREAHQHKLVLSSLARLRQKSKSQFGWLERSFGFASAFVL